MILNPFVFILVILMFLASCWEFFITKQWPMGLYWIGGTIINCVVLLGGIK